VSVSVELLSLGSGSVVPAGGLTIAVLTKSPMADAETIPVTAKVTEPPPAGTLTVADSVLPEPLAPLATLAPPDALLVHVTPVMAAGIRSDTVAPVALLGPLLVTVIVYVSGLPGV
jgi:hypothetical protein